MLYINKLTNDPQQQAILTGISGQSITLTLRFMPRIQRWIMGIGWGDVSIQGIAVCTAPNILRQWRNILPFGIACINANSLDPFTIDDFSNQQSNLYLLDSEDVQEVENVLTGAEVGLVA